MVIDIGNSRIKAATFEDFSLTNEFTCKSLEELVTVIGQLLFDEVIISSVKMELDEIRATFPFPFTYFTTHTPLPVRNLYSSSNTLGVDRIAAVVGALSFMENGPCLTIDMGTCITYDFMNGKNEYLGGAISPGINMRFRAMHDQTARLPLTKLTGEMVDVTGSNTVTCLKSGVYYGVRYEVEGAIAQYKNHHGELKVFICGGDANFFESLTKDYIFVIPNLILHGLNRILRYNVNKK